MLRMPVHINTTTTCDCDHALHGLTQTGRLICCTPSNPLPPYRVLPKRKNVYLSCSSLTPCLNFCIQRPRWLAASTTSTKHQQHIWAQSTMTVLIPCGSHQLSLIVPSHVMLMQNLQTLVHAWVASLMLTFHVATHWSCAVGHSTSTPNYKFMSLNHALMPKLMSNQGIPFKKMSPTPHWPSK